MQLKKLLAFLLLVPSIAVCSSLQLSGSGTGSLAINASLMTVYPATATASFPFGLSASTANITLFNSPTTFTSSATFRDTTVYVATATVSSATVTNLNVTGTCTNCGGGSGVVVPSTYTWGSVTTSSFTATAATLGSAGNAVQISSNAIIASTTFYQNGPALTNSAGYIIGTVITSSECFVNASSATTLSTYISTKLSCSITPKVSTSYIRITFWGLFDDTNIGSCDGAVTLYRGNTDISPWGASRGMSVITGGGAVESASIINNSLNDSPATTSQTTYTVKIRVQAGAGTITWGAGGGQYMRLEEIPQ